MHKKPQTKPKAMTEISDIEREKVGLLKSTSLPLESNKL